MKRREYDRIIARLSDITNDAIKQISKTTSPHLCINIFISARTKMLSEIMNLRRKVHAGEITKDEYYLIISRYASSQMHLVDAIKKQMFHLIDEEAIKLMRMTSS